MVVVAPRPLSRLIKQPLTGLPSRIRGKLVKNQARIQYDMTNSELVSCRNAVLLFVASALRPARA